MTATAIPPSLIIFITLIGSALAVTIVGAFARYYQNPEHAEAERYGMRPPDTEQEDYMRQVRRRGLPAWMLFGGGGKHPPPRPSYGYNGYAGEYAGGNGGGGGGGGVEAANYPTYPPNTATGGSGYNNYYGYGNAYGDGSKRYSSGMPSPMNNHTPPSAGGGRYYEKDAPMSPAAGG